MKQRILGTILGISIFLMVGCQPTPDGPIVGNKNDGKLEEQLKATPAPTASYEAPETVKEKFENAKGDISVSIDAKAVLPEANIYPVKVVKAKQFELEWAEKLLAYFAPGTEELYSVDIRDTRAELEKSIHDTEATIEQCKERGDFETAELQEVWLARLRENLKTAPETRERYSLPMAFQYDAQLGGNYLKGKVDLADGSVVAINIKNTARGSDVSCGHRNYTCEWQREINLGNDIARMDKTEVQALQEAEAFLQEMEIKGYVCSGRINAYHVTYDERDRATEYGDPVYCFQFALAYDAIEMRKYDTPVSIDSDVLEGYTPPQALEYTAMLGVETLYITVDDSGILGINWSNPAEDVEVLNENVEMMPFEEVLEKARKYVFFQLASMDGIEQGISIAEIRLSYLRIQRKDSPYEYLLVPVWDFVGTQSIAQSAGRVSRYTNVSFATINAIDGTLINRAMQ